jgi:hypothetical protein
MKLLKSLARHPSRLSSICGAAMLTALLIAGASARADSVAAYTLFAGHSIVGSGTVTATGGLVGSNSDLFLNPS